MNIVPSERKLSHQGTGFLCAQQFQQSILETVLVSTLYMAKPLFWVTGEKNGECKSPFWFSEGGSGGKGVTNALHLGSEEMMTDA